MDGTIYVKPERIRQYVIDLFGYYHVSKADAGMIADNLIDAEIRSVTTHGLTRIPLYTEKLISGLCDARAVPEIVRDFAIMRSYFLQTSSTFRRLVSEHKLLFCNIQNVSDFLQVTTDNICTALFYITI